MFEYYLPSHSSPFDPHYVLQQRDPYHRAAELERERRRRAEIEAIEQARYEAALREGAAYEQQLRREAAIREQQQRRRRAQLQAEAEAQRRRQHAAEVARRQQLAEQSALRSAQHYQEEDDEEADQDPWGLFNSPFGAFFGHPQSSPRHRQRRTTPSHEKRHTPHSSGPVNIPITTTDENVQHDASSQRVPGTPQTHSRQQSPQRNTSVPQYSEIHEQAAVLIQTTWRTLQTRQTAFKKIAEVRRDFQTLQSEFVLPVDLDFEPVSAEGAIPKLSFASVNRPVHSYEHEALKLLTRLDAIESAGDQKVRDARKYLVNEIEGALEALEHRKIEAWKQSTGQTPTTNTPQAPVSLQTAESPISTPAHSEQDIELEEESISTETHNTEDDDGEEWQGLTSSDDDDQWVDAEEDMSD